MSNDPQNLYTARQSQAIDAKALELMHLTGFELMQKAGQKLFDDLKTLIQDHQRIAIFCGPGNNGGDGLVCAALATKKGYQVEVFFTQQTTLLSIPSSIHLFTYLLHVPSFSIQRLSNGFHRRR